MILIGNYEERQYRKFQKIIADFPWLYAVKNEWMYGIDEVKVTKRLTDLRAMLLSPARNDHSWVWVYREFVQPRGKFPISCGAVMVPHSDGKTLWAKQIVETTSSCARIRFMALKFPHDHFYTIYRSEGGDFNQWVERLSETHPFNG